MADEYHKYPFWAPRFWHGMPIQHWLPLLARNGGRVHPSRWGLAATVSLCSIFNTKMGILQEALYGHAIRSTTIDPSPVFIIGHWRSGTTYLHELLSHDHRFVTPNNYQCFAPNHFVLTQSTIPLALWYAIPSQRPMDNVELSWETPQEDEFALCSMGLPSPYARIAFPNRPAPNLEYLHMEGLTPAEIDRWSAGLIYFLKAVMFRRTGRIVLKSPTHTGRIGLLVKLFPQARFIHLVRDPWTLYPSTIRLWHSLDLVQGFQYPTSASLPDYVLDAFDHMYQGFDRHVDALAVNQLCHVHYERLVQNPLGELARIYEQLELGDLGPVREKLSQIVAQKKEYRTNSYELSAEQRQIVTTRWARYIDRFGYTPAAATIG